MGKLLSVRSMMWYGGAKGSNGGDAVRVAS
jgi:hypothetical protein